MSHRIALSSVVLIVWLFCGCSSGPDSAADEQPTEQPAVQLTEVEQEVHRYMHAGPSPVIVQFRPQTIEEDLFPIVDDLASMAGRSMTGVVAEIDPRIGALFDGDDHLVAADRPSYYSRQLLAGPGYFEALQHGAVLQPEGVSAQAIHRRYLVSTDDPEQLAQVLENRHRTNDQIAVRAEDHFVRLDVIEILPSRSGIGDRLDRMDDDQAAEYRDDLVQRAVSREASSFARPRTTPALQMFRQTDAPVSVYFRSEDLLLAMISDMIIDTRQMRVNTPIEMEERVLGRLLSVANAILAFSPRSEFEHEDTFAALHSDGAGGVILDAVNTQTERGQQIASHVGSSQSIDATPAINSPEAPEDDDDPRALSIDFLWNFDAAAATADFPAPDAAETAASMASLADHFRSAGPWGSMQLITPAPTLALRGALTDNNISFPRAGHVAMEIDRNTDSPEVEFHSVGSAYFADPILEDELPLFVRHLQNELSHGEHNLEISASARDNRRIDGRIGSRAKNEATERVYLDNAFAVLEFQLHPSFRNIPGDGPEMMMLSDLLGLDNLRIQWRPDFGLNHYRIQLGDGDLDAPHIPVIDGFEPAETAPGCLDDVQRETRAVFQNLGDISKDPSPEEMDALFEAYDQHSTDCADRAPDHADSLELARTRIRSMVELLTDDGSH